MTKGLFKSQAMFPLTEIQAKEVLTASGTTGEPFGVLIVRRFKDYRLR